MTFFIFLYDALKEPPHLHIVKEKGNRQKSAKIWLDSLKIVNKGSLTINDLNQALRIIKNNQQKLIDTFNKVKDRKKIATIKFK